MMIITSVSELLWSVVTFTRNMELALRSEWL